MEVYHASIIVVEHPDTVHSRAQKALNECLTFKSSQPL